MCVFIICLLGGWTTLKKSAWQVGSFPQVEVNTLIKYRKPLLQGNLMMIL